MKKQIDEHYAQDVIRQWKPRNGDKESCIGSFIRARAEERLAERLNDVPDGKGEP